MNLKVFSLSLSIKKTLAKYEFLWEISKFYDGGIEVAIQTFIIAWNIIKKILPNLHKKL